MSSFRALSPLLRIDRDRSRLRRLVNEKVVGLTSSLDPDPAVADFAAKLVERAVGGGGAAAGPEVEAPAVEGADRLAVGHPGSPHRTVGVRAAAEEGMDHPGGVGVAEQGDRQPVDRHLPAAPFGNLGHRADIDESRHPRLAPGLVARFPADRNGQHYRKADRSEASLGEIGWLASPIFCDDILKELTVERAGWVRFATRSLELRAQVGFVWERRV